MGSFQSLVLSPPALPHGPHPHTGVRLTPADMALLHWQGRGGSKTSNEAQAGRKEARDRLMLLKLRKPVIFLTGNGDHIIAKPDGLRC